MYIYDQQGTNALTNLNYHHYYSSIITVKHLFSSSCVSLTIRSSDYGFKYAFHLSEWWQKKRKPLRSHEGWAAYRQVLAAPQVRSNQMKSNPKKSNEIQIKSNQIKSNQIKSNAYAASLLATTTTTTHWTRLLSTDGLPTIHI